MSILNLTEDEKLLYEKYNQSPDIIVKEETPIEEPVKVAEPVKAEEPVQLQTEPVKFTQEEINLYNKYNSTPKEQLGEPLPEPSFLRQLGYGWRQERFLIRSGIDLAKAGITAFFDPNRTYEEVRAQNEEKRQRKIAFDYPDMFGREESGAVLAGRLLSTGIDVSSFLVPWAKFAKFGTLTSAAAVGTYGAADVAIRDEALYGEVNPVNVAIGFGGGFALGAAMEAGMKYYRTASRGKIKTQTSDGQSVEKEVNIPGPTPNPAKVNADEIPQIEKTAKEALLESDDAVKSIGNKFGQVEKLILEKQKLKKEIQKIAQEKRLILKKKWSPEMKKLINEEWNTYYKGVKTKNTKLIDELDEKISDLNNKIEIQYLQMPSDFLKIYKDGMLAGFRNNVLNEGYARALVQEAVRPLFGGLVGGGVGAAFTGEGDDNTLMISFALLGAGFMQYQKIMQSKEFKLIPQTIKDAANNEFVTSYRRSFYNRLKSLTAGSHIQDLMGWSDEVGVQYGARMFPAQGGGVTTGRISTVRPVEEEAMSKLLYWNSRKMELLAELDDEILILAGKISNQRNMPSTAKYSFLTKEDKLNPRFAEAERLSLDIDKYTDDFAEYVRARGINFNEQDVYGLTQMLKPITDATQVDKIISDLTVAYRIQNENIRKKLTAKQLKDKKFIEENFPTLNYKPEVLAEGHVATAGGFRRNSIFSDSDDKLFKTNDSAIANFKSRDEDFVLQATKHFDKDRTLFDQEARASVADLFEQNPFNTLDRLINNTVKVAEFSKQFGSRGQLIKKIFSDINARYKKLGDPEDKFETVDSLFNARPGIRAAADREKQKIKDSLEAYFGVYGIDAVPKSDFGRTFTSFLQAGLAATRLTGVAVPSMGDWLQTITNSGYKAAFRGAISDIKLSKETLSLGKTKKQIEGKDASYIDKFLGRNRSDTLVQRQLEDVLLLTDTTGMRKWQQRISNFTKEFFEAVQLGRVTRIARTFAYDSGVYRVMDIADLISKGKTRTLLTSEKALLKEIDTLGLNMNNIRHISKFNTLEEAIADPLARTLLNRAGIRAANRDAIIPMIGNRRLFTQTKNPYVKFLGTFLSWAQAKSSQTNALVSRIEEGDIALFLKILASIPLFMTVREAQVLMSPSEQYKEAVSDETTAQKFGEAIGFTGINTYGVEKIRSIIDSDKYGSDFIEQLSPALGYLNDIGDIAIKGGSDLLDDDDETNMEELAKWLKTISKTIPIVEEVAPRIERAIEGEKPKAQFTEGGLVKGTEDVPYTEENPADRINPVTGEPYSETSQGVLATLKARQADRVPVVQGGLLANLQRRKKFGVGGLSVNVAKLLGLLPNKVYRGGTSRIVDSPEGTESVFVATDKVHADSFAEPDAFAKVVVTEGKSLEVPKDKMNLHEIDISSAKNPYILDEPSESMKRQIEKDLMDVQDDNKFNALMSLLHPEESDLRVASSDFYPINREVGKYLKEKGYDIATDRKTIEEGFIDNPAAELFLLKKFPVKVIDRVKVRTQEVVDEIKGKQTNTVKVPTWFKETQVKTDIDPADAQKTQVGITSGTYKKVKNLLKEGNTLDYGAGLGQGAKILNADSYEPFPKKGFTPTVEDTTLLDSFSYDNIVSLNVLNVVPPDTRKDIVLEIGRLLKNNGKAIITTRGSDIFGNQNNITKGVLSKLEDGAIITSSGTYQKGFTNQELKEYVSGILGEGYEVTTLTGLGKAGVQIEKGIFAKHATKADFDKFDLNYIGTGEGAQVYSNGIYFAESDEVISFYKQAFDRELSDITTVVSKYEDNIIDTFETSASFRVSEKFKEYFTKEKPLPELVNDALKVVKKLQKYDILDEDYNFKVLGNTQEVITRIASQKTKQLAKDFKLNKTQRDRLLDILIDNYEDLGTVFSNESEFLSKLISAIVTPGLSKVRANGLRYDLSSSLEIAGNKTLIPDTVNDVSRASGFGKLIFDTSPDTFFMLKKYEYNPLITKLVIEQQLQVYENPQLFSKLGIAPPENVGANTKLKEYVASLKNENVDTIDFKEIYNAAQTLGEGRYFLNRDDYIRMLKELEEITPKLVKETKEDKVAKILEVYIKAKDENLIDWDKAISQQSEEVQESIGKLFYDLINKLDSNLLPKSAEARSELRQLREIIRDYENEFTDVEELIDYYNFGITRDFPTLSNSYIDLYKLKFEQDIAKYGVKGVKYLDGVSRGQGRGTYNYVVYDTDIINISKKYGVALPFAAAYFAQQEQTKPNVEE